ncbi:MAG TPA: DUF4118 domain-containing protein [Terriglobales bacterium]|jgi:integral membrane sensor domain MASE1|nr:DUF4118 domain-containing protein [Terriglobales bacterium]
MPRWTSASIGAGLSVATATVLILIFHSSSLRFSLPLIFLGIILVVAIRFGSTAGVLGTIAAAMIFAVFLFEPWLSLAVQDSVAKDRLIWMVLIGIIISDLLGPHNMSPTTRRKR